MLGISAKQYFGLRKEENGDFANFVSGNFLGSGIHYCVYEFV
jgi:hypothetical protein